MSNRKALGKGLEALIPTSAVAAEEGVGIREIEIGRIEVNPEQPRTRFDQRALEELADSIRLHGVVQPIVVTARGDMYRLVIGERRVRASRLAGVDRVPAVVREVGETGALELALVENLQREDLNPIDEARGYEALMEAGGLTQADAADRVGKDRSSIANALRLLDLGPDIQEMVAGGALSAGHARALLGLAGARERRALADRAVKKALSVREVEALVRGRSGRRKKTRARRVDDPVVREWEERLQRVFGTLVRIERMGGEGTIRIEYYSQEELDRILDLLVSVGQGVM